MSPSKDQCTVCDHPFYRRQEFIYCKGCQLRSHTKCLKKEYSDAEISIYIETNTYKCIDCLGNRMVLGDNTPVSGPRKPISPQLTSDQIGDACGRRDPNLVVIDLNVLDDLLESKFACMAGSFLGTLSNLRSELKAVKRENIRLRESVVSLTKACAASVLIMCG